MERKNFESKLDFHKSWSMKAGELSGLRAAESFVMKEALESFAANRPDDSNLRRIAQELGKFAKEASDELQEYINLSPKF